MNRENGGQENGKKKKEKKEVLGICISG